VNPYRTRLGRGIRGYLFNLWADAELAYRTRILELVASARPTSLLDLGCHDGEWTCQLVQASGGSVERAAGVEVVEEARQEAERRGIEAVAANLNDRLPFAEASFDLIHANQVIEHVVNLDGFVMEISRVLRPGGRAIVCTENLASWHNIAALVLGFMPFSLTNISSRGTIGNPFNLASTPSAELETSWFHTRVLTAVGLVHLFRVHSLDVVERFASGYHPLPPRLARVAAQRDVRHAAFIGVVAEKAVPLTVFTKPRRTPTRN
jgi:SAM-dependent methyltransferase